MDLAIYTDLTFQWFGRLSLAITIVTPGDIVEQSIRYVNMSALARSVGRDKTTQCLVVKESSLADVAHPTSSRPMVSLQKPSDTSIR